MGHPPRLTTLLWGVIVSVQAQIRIQSPASLIAEFPETHGNIYGTTATFGTPYYGERITGQLLFGQSKTNHFHCTKDDYDITPHQVPSNEGQPLVNIIIVRRGECTFVTKVRVAETYKQAHAVIVVDKEDSTKTSEDIQRIIMADDGWGNNIKIPSVLVSKYDGQRLIDAVMSNQDPVIAELAWDIPQSEVVLADFWMSSGSREANEFLTNFKTTAETLKYYIQFAPHYHVFGLPADYNHLCLDASAKFCAPDPDGQGPVTGSQVVSEDLRRICIWHTTAKPDPGNPHGATYSNQYWEYVVQFFRECTFEVDETSKEAAWRFGEECSERVMTATGINVQDILTCAKVNADKYLNEEKGNVAWSPLALRLNGWRYSGPLDPETVLKAICSGYMRTPQECRDLMEGHRTIFNVQNGLSMSTVVWTFTILGMFICLGFYLYKRYVTKSMRSVLREEVMLEVQTQMTDYAPLSDRSDPNSQRGSQKPLSF